MKVPTEPLRDHIIRGVTRLAEKFPTLASALDALKERSIPRFAEENMDFQSVEDALEAIVRDAEELDTNGYLFAIGQQLTNELESISRSALSAGVLVFPELGVELSSARAGTEGEVKVDKPKPGFRTRFGGKPQWLQSDATPICEECGKAMTFVAQIDSVAHQDSELGQLLVEKKSFMFADIGMIYVFWCAGCNGTRSVLQSG